MSMETVLKQIFTFATTLNKAHTDEVSKWDSKCIQNAFNWAKYAEEVYTKLKDRAFRKELNVKIQEMTLYLSPPSCLQICFDDLGKSTEILFFTLIQNPHFPEKYAQDLMVSYNSNLRRFDIDIISKCATLSSEMTSLVIVQEETKSTGLGKTENMLHFESQAKLMLEGISRVVKTISITSKADSYVKKLLERIVTIKSGFSVIISMYLMSGMSEDENEQNMCQSIFQFLQHVNIPLEDVPFDLLLEVAGLDYRFAEILLKLLINKASSFICNMNADKSYTWEFKDINHKEIHMTFDQLCNYFKHLSKANRRTKQIVMEKLTDCSACSMSSNDIFKEILKNI